MSDSKSFAKYSAVPVDQNRQRVAFSTAGFSQALTANGSWQAVVVSEECKAVSIACDNGSATYDHITNPTEFHFSFNSAGTGRRATANIEVSIAAQAGDTIGYVRATSGLIFNIQGIY